VRFPDQNTYPSVPYLGTQRSTFISNANSNAARAFFPYPNYCDLAPASITAGNVVTWTGGASRSVIQYANLNSTVQSFRVPAWGVRLSCLSSITTASGLAYIAVVPWEPHLAPSVNLPTSEDEFTSCVWHTIVPVSELTTRPMIIPGRLLDESVHRYRAIGSVYPSVVPTAEIETTTGHVCVAVLVVGATSGTAILGELVTHIEAIPRPSLGQFDALPSPYSQKALEQQRYVDIGMPTAYIESQFSRVLKSAVGWAGRMLSGAANQAANEYLNGAMRAHFGRSTAPPTTYMRSAEPERIEWKEDYMVL